MNANLRDAYLCAILRLNTPLKEMAERNKKYFDPTRIEDEVKMSLEKVTHQDILNVIMRNREVDRKRHNLVTNIF